MHTQTRDVISMIARLLAVKLNLNTFVAVLVSKIQIRSLSSSSSYTGINHFKQIHCKLIRNGEIKNILIAGKFVGDVAISSPQNLSYARSVIAGLDFHPNIFMWNSLIRGYANSFNPRESIVLYKNMLIDGFVPNNYTFTFIFKACTQLMNLHVGLGFHGSIIKYGFEDSDVFIQTSLLNFYASCGSLNIARHLFDKIPKRDITCWNALIKGYVCCYKYAEAIKLFKRMQDQTKMVVDEITMLAVVVACGNLGALDMGRWIHAFINKNCLNFGLNLVTSLVDMYAKCGDLCHAYDLFEKMPHRDVRAWSVMIDGFASHGYARQALDLFHQMLQFDIKPDSVTFTALLKACSHGGLVEKGLTILDDMTHIYSLEPTIEHYGCVVDLLGRAGRLNDAICLIKKISLQPDVVLWGGLLVSCRLHKDIEMGKLAAEEILKLDPQHVGAHIFLSNLYASSGNWDLVEEVRNKMKDQKIKKRPGSSLIEMDGDFHEFIAGDRSHHQDNQIRKMLDEIARLLRLEGHTPTTKGIDFDIEEEEKEEALLQHSEKLAIAFGLINTRPGSTVRIVKNLRICQDCHTWTKLVAKVFDRLIIVRDRNRFHHFKDGICSCADYW